VTFWYVQIRIRILGSIPLTNGCGCGKPKNIRNTGKKSQRSDKTGEIKVFLTIFAWWWKDPELDPEPGPYLWLTNPGAETGGPKIYWSHGSRSGSGYWRQLTEKTTLQNTVSSCKVLYLICVNIKLSLQGTWRIKLLCMYRFSTQHNGISHRFLQVSAQTTCNPRSSRYKIYTDGTCRVTTLD
jgi:hypothetical protein